MQRRHRHDALSIADYVLVTMRGLSSFARPGISQKPLVDVARMAGRTLEEEFAGLSAGTG